MFGMAQSLDHGNKRGPCITLFINTGEIVMHFNLTLFCIDQKHIKLVGSAK